MGGSEEEDTRRRDLETKLPAYANNTEGVKKSEKVISSVVGSSARCYIIGSGGEC